MEITMRIQQQTLPISNNYNNNNKDSNNRKNNSPSYKGALDGLLTTTLRTLDTNPMANAVGIDLFAMVAPRTYVDTKERNKYAGAETFFREFTGTLIVCLSASYLAKGIAHLANKLIEPKTPINPNSWFSKDSIDVLNDSWNNSGNNTKTYVSNILEGVSGRDGKNVNHFNNIDWKNVEWVDEKRWSNISWDNKKYNGVQDRLKNKDSLVSTISELIDNKSITKKDRKNLLTITESRLTNALGASSVSVSRSGKSLSSSNTNLLRDMVDMGKDVFTNKNVETSKAINKLLKTKLKP
jgi:hypothetical protein